MSKGKLIIIKGLPKSGKTELAKRLCEEEDAVRLSWSELRQSDDAEDTFSAMLEVMKKMRWLLRAGRVVVLDECNLYGPSYFIFQTVAMMEKVRVVWKSTGRDVEECKQRSLQAGLGSVEIMRLDMLWKKYKLWLKR